jgi:hypothetical protein
MKNSAATCDFSREIFKTFNEMRKLEYILLITKGFEKTVTVVNVY